MSSLQQHRCEELIGLGHRQEPGTLVRHLSDERSLGMVIGRVDQQVEVLWSRQPPSVWFTPEDFRPRKSVLTRYGSGVLNPSSYNRIEHGGDR